jgi:CRISPR/Cas system CSM-associated protein Csm3 (group 7 of RAMP superfamily)
MQIRISGVIELASPLHIGSGSLADALADKPLLKDAAGLPVIPGSALKGKTRHMAEQIVRGLWHEETCEAPYAERMCQGAARAGLCPVCRIFGAPGYPAPIRFGAFTLQLAPGLALPPGRSLEGRIGLQVRAGVGLDRARRTAAEDILYTVETHAPSPALVFQGEIYGEVADRREAALLAGALAGVRTLGGNRSRGLGWCRIVPAVTLDGAAQDLAALLKELAQ